MAKLLTNEQFQEKANIKHNFKYKYPSLYIGLKYKIDIICSSHGLFKQNAGNHLQGQGCPACKNITTSLRCRKTTDLFIIDAINIHGPIYDYSSVVYITCEDKVKIICKEHGMFEQIPNNHLQGQGCPICAGKGIWDNKRFIKESILIYGNIFDYSLVSYKNNMIPVKIICKKHGIFEQTPNAHLNSNCGCSICSRIKQAQNNTKTTQEFISEAISFYGDIYDYSNTIYIGCFIGVSIRCKECNKSFTKSPSNHLRGQGCPYCSKSQSISKLEIEWLNSLLIPDEYRQINIIISNNKKYIVDAYNPNTNIIYEFYGDYWHGNPIRFAPEEYNQQAHTTHGELYQKTLDKESALKLAGYNLITIWESEWNTIKKSQKVKMVSNG